MNTRITTITAALGTLAWSGLLSANPWDGVETSSPPAALSPERVLAEAQSNYIVQASSVDAARAAVLNAGGSVTHDLGIISSAGARLTASQAALLEGKPGLSLFADAALEVAGTPQPDTFYPSVISADRLHAQGITGKGVTVAVIDTGVWEGSGWRVTAAAPGASSATTGLYQLIVY